MFEKSIDNMIQEYYNSDVDKTEHMFEYTRRIAHWIRDCL